MTIGSFITFVVIMSSISGWGHRTATSLQSAIIIKIDDKVYRWSSRYVCYVSSALPGERSVPDLRCGQNSIWYSFQYLKFFSWRILFFFIKNGFDTFWLYLPKKKRQKRFNQYLGPSRAHKISGNLLETTFPLTFFFSVYITMTCYHHIKGLICIIITEINRKLSTPCFMKCFVLFVFVLFGFVFFITSF